MKKLLIRGFVVLLLLVALGGLGLRLFSPHLISFSSGIGESTVGLSLKTLEGAHLIGGMEAAENIFLVPGATRLFVTDLSGQVHLVDGPSRDKLAIVKSVRLGRMALGIDRGPDGWIYVGATDHDSSGWMAKGGAIHRLNAKLENLERITSEYPSLNGLAFDNKGNCYFASSNFSFLFPQGQVYRMAVSPDGAITPPVVHIPDAGLANGVHHSASMGQMVVSKTLGGLLSFPPGQSVTTALYLKTRLTEATDDLCTDRKGRVWMADPGISTIKMFDPKEKVLVRYIIEGVGQTSSCGIRSEEGGEVLYITELKTRQEPLSKEYDGRGVVVIPLRALEGE